MSIPLGHTTIAVTLARSATPRLHRYLLSVTQATRDRRQKLRNYPVTAGIRRQWPATAIDSKLTAMGKDERALSVSGYVYRGNVKYTEYAFNKTTIYKRKSRNHLSDQIESFRIGEGQQTRGRSFGHVLLWNRSCSWRRRWLLTTRMSRRLSLLIADGVEGLHDARRGGVDYFRSPSITDIPETGSRDRPLCRQATPTWSVSCHEQMGWMAPAHDI
jgi:hypothetical protein